MANTYLQRTGISAGNRRIWTWSAWIKRTSIGEQRLFNHEQSSGTSQISVLKFDGNDNLLFADNTGSGNSINLNASLRKFRDTNAWFHIVLRIDTTDSTSNDRARIYLNGLDMRTNPDGHGYSSYTQPSQDYDTFANQSGNKITLGAWVNNTNQYFDGIMSHVVYTDGYSYGPEQFGETDSTTGEWKFKVPTGISYGTNGFYILKDGNGVTDTSGQGNNFSVGGGNLTKTEDSPSNIFATWSALHTSQESISNVVFKYGNTGFDNNETTGGVYPQTYSTLAASSGKYYFESKLIATNLDSSFIGISGAVTTEAYVGENAYTYVYRSNGVVRNNDTDGNTYTSYGVNDIIQIAVDLDNNKLYFGINGTWVNSGDPTSGATGTGAVYTITAPSNTPHGVYHFTLGDTSSSGTFEHATNFGNGYFGTTAVSSAGTNASGIGIFEYDVPTGYTALSTKGLNE